MPVAIDEYGRKCLAVEDIAQKVGVDPRTVYRKREQFGFSKISLPNDKKTYFLLKDIFGIYPKLMEKLDVTDVVDVSDNFGDIYDIEHEKSAPSVVDVSDTSTVEVYQQSKILQNIMPRLHEIDQMSQLFPKMYESIQKQKDDLEILKKKKGSPVSFKKIWVGFSVLGLLLIILAVGIGFGVIRFEKLQKDTMQTYTGHLNEKDHLLEQHKGRFDGFQKKYMEDMKEYERTLAEKELLLQKALIDTEKLSAIVGNQKNLILQLTTVEKEETNDRNNENAASL